MTRPTGTVTFLFTDLESSTRLWEDHPDDMRAALARHDELMRAVVDEHDGYLFGTAGDAVSAAFPTAEQAVDAAVDAQRRLRAEAWPGQVELRSRMGIHTGVAQERDGDYFGSVVNRTARICAAGHGGQVLLSSASAELLGDDRELRDLGRHRLKDLDEPQHLRQVVVDGDADVYPPLRGTVEARHNLPLPRTSFHGRGSEVDALTEHLSSERILTLNGPGGVGKTRLSLELARRELDRRDAVVFVDLSAIESPDAVTEAILTAASLPVDVAREDQLGKLARAWRNRRVLLVLDNCEHLLDATAAVVDRLTARCEAVDVLATSREPLGIDGERVHRLPSLDPQAAVQLFLARARDARGDLVVAAHDETLVRGLCERLDGLPLAIELAASRVAHLGVAEIADHLDDRFRLLTGSRRHARRRQQTLRATVDWSYDLLDEDERSLLRATAVFVGRFELESLVAVWGRDRLTTVDAVSSLVDKSLVTVADRGEAIRYRLLETIRLYALERLVDEGEAEERRGAHARYLLEQAQAHPPRIADIQTWGHSDREPVHDLENQLAALDWFEERGDLTAVGRMAGRLATLLGYERFVDHGDAYLGREDVLDALADPDERALYLTATAMNANYLGRYAEQLEFGKRAVVEARDPATRGAASVWLAVAWTVYDPDQVEAAVDAGLRDLPTDAGWTRRMLENLRTQAAIAQGRYHDALLQLDSVRDLPDPFPITELMLTRHLVGQDPSAGLDDIGLRTEGTPWAYRVPLIQALVAAAHGDHAGAAAALVAAAKEAEARQHRMFDEDVLVGCAAAAYHRRDFELASRLLAIVGGWTRSPGTHALYRHYRELVRRELDAERAREIVAAARGQDVIGALEEELDHLRGIAGAPPDPG